jgi:hypothetical protein
MMEDCWYCPKCVAEWQAEFDACQHDWEPHVSVMGDDGQYCKNCSGFVANEDWQTIFGESKSPGAQP